MRGIRMLSIWALSMWSLSSGFAFAQQGIPLDPVPAETPRPADAAPASVTDIAKIRPCEHDNGWRHGFWFRADYLRWTVKDGPLVAPLVTAGSDADDPFQGSLGRSGTRSIFGGNGLDFGIASGLRLSAGLPLTADGGLSLEVDWLQLKRTVVLFGAASDAGGAPVLARPIRNAVTGQENSELESSPLVGLAGGIRVASSSRLQGLEINLATQGPRGPAWDVGMFLGVRLLDLNEDIVIEDTFRDITGAPGGAGLTFLGAPVLTSAPLTGYDSFHVRNQFYGPQLGVRANWERNWLSLGLVGKVALGWSQQLIIIDGASTAIVNPGDVRSSSAGAVLTQNSNIGRHFRDKFAVVPEIGASVGVQLTHHLRARVGYTFLYWSSVARPGDAIDRTVNRFNVPSDQNFGPGTGPARPALAFSSTDYWAQGISFSLEFRY